MPSFFSWEISIGNKPLFCVIYYCMETITHVVDIYKNIYTGPNAVPVICLVLAFSILTYRILFVINKTK